MKFIKKSDMLEYTNILTIEDKKYYELPYLICEKCFSLVPMKVQHRPEEGLLIKDCKCDK